MERIAHHLHLDAEPRRSRYGVGGRRSRSNSPTGEAEHSSRRNRYTEGFGDVRHVISTHHPAAFLHRRERGRSAPTARRSSPHRVFPAASRRSSLSNHAGGARTLCDAISPPREGENCAPAPAGSRPGPECRLRRRSRRPQRWPCPAITISSAADQPAQGGGTVSPRRGVGRA